MPRSPKSSAERGSAHPRRHAAAVAAAAPQPVFAQPQPSADPTSFRDPVTDLSDKELAILEPIPPSRDNAAEPILELASVLGAGGAAAAEAITRAGQIVFHSVGDTGSAKGPSTQSLVADKMVADFTEAASADVPAFFFNLGDLVYYFGEAAYYFDQFYDPYRDYPAPILSVAGNHDGVLYATDPAPTLAAFLNNLCTPEPIRSPDAGGLLRTTMIQPGVYFTFDAPFVRILGVYSNVLEDPGVISSQGGTNALSDVQLTFLKTALARAKSEKYKGAVILAVHHPPFTGATVHGGSPKMLADIDAACTSAGFWPHAVFSGHAHNYQRYTRTAGGRQTPYIVAGCGGHSPLSAMRGTYRTPYTIDDELTLESYDATHYGYLRVLVNATEMTVEYHTAEAGVVTKTPQDRVTIQLAERTIG